MSIDSSKQYPDSKAKRQAFTQGSLAVMPLIIAVIPWGILAGSYAMEVGLSALESQAMSAIIFGGAAQLVALGMINAGTGLLSILITTALVTSRHCLYSMVLRPQLSPLPLKWRLVLGFLLTDELFAIVAKNHKQRSDRWFALGGGLSFYIGWNLATLVGIIAGQTIPNLSEWGLDFAMAATFIALAIPLIKNVSTLICTLVSLISAIIFAVLDVQAGLLIAALLGMAAATLFATLRGKN